MTTAELREWMHMLEDHRNDWTVMDFFKGLLDVEDPENLEEFIKDECERVLGLCDANYALVGGRGSPAVVAMVALMRGATMGQARAERESLRATG